MGDRKLTDGDVAAIVKELSSVQSAQVPCECVVDPETLKAAVKFFENINSWFDGTKRTIWNTVLVASVLGLLGLISLGVWGKLQK